MTATTARSPRERLAPIRRSLPRWLPEALTLFAVALFTWPLLTLMPTLVGLDGSWPVGLHMAAHRGLDFGDDIIYTYGPLGFLKEPLAIYPWTTRFAVAYTGIIQLLLCGALLWALSRGLRSLTLAALGTFFLAPLFGQEPALPVAFIGAVAVGAGLLPTRAVPWVAGLGGAFTAVEVLGKINTGVTVLALAAIALFVAPVRRRTAAIAFAAAFVPTLAFAWIATGQSVHAIPGFVSGSLAIASGYSEAMGIEFPPGREWEYWAALVLVLIGVAAAWTAGAGLKGRTRAGLVAMWAVLAFTTFKSGFVRHDPGHVNIFFVSMLGGLAAFAWAARRQTVALVGLLCLTMVFASLQQDPADTVMPFDRADAFFSQLTTLSDGSETNKEVGAAKAFIVSGYGVDPQTIAAIGAHDVHIDPADAEVARAYALDWDPTPVFQAYSAYTASLDNRNADKLEHPSGPERILRAPQGTIDGRNTAWESPAAVRAMLCNFRPIRTTDRWQVLARTSSRCGEPRPIGESDPRWGEPAHVPTARSDEAVYGKVEGVAVAGLEKIAALAHRPAQRSAELDGGRVFHLIPGTAENGLLVRVPPAADFPGPFALNQNATTIIFRRGTGDQPDGRLRVRWFALPIR